MRYGWWGYVKDMIRRYPDGDMTPSELNAVVSAIEETERMPNGRARMKVIELVLWKGTHTLDGAALKIHYHKNTVQKWQADFIIRTAKNFKCDGLI